MQPLDSPEAARAAISETLFVRPGLVLVRADGVTQFAHTVFPGIGTAAALYARHTTSYGPANGDQGFRFEWFHDLVHPGYPLYAAFNVSWGPAEYVAAVLDDDLLRHYLQNYPSGTSTAAAARVLISDLGFKQNTPRDRGTIAPGVGMVIPQVSGMSAVIHRITPEALHGPGSQMSLVELFVPKPEPHAFEAAARLGFGPF